MQSLPHSKRKYKQLVAFFIVALTMIVMFAVPRSYFVLGSIVSTSAMICVTFLLLGKKKDLLKPDVRFFILALVVAIVLYIIFLAGNIAIKAFQLPGMSVASEKSIYDLFKNVPLPLLLIVLVLDAVGFESYFRGNILENISKEIGVGSVFASALLDAVIHFSTLNPLFPATTFVADSVWGLYYYETRDLTSTITCHFIWDVMIFVLFPIH